MRLFDVVFWWQWRWIPFRFPMLRTTPAKWDLYAVFQVLQYMVGKATRRNWQRKVKKKRKRWEGTRKSGQCIFIAQPLQKNLKRKGGYRIFSRT